MEFPYFKWKFMRNYTTHFNYYITLSKYLVYIKNTTTYYGEYKFVKYIII